MIYLDQRGAGRSDPGRPEDHRVERWADDVHGFCTALRIERPIVLGLGFGGIALDYAARYPDHPGALVLIAPVARMVPERSIEVYERLGGAEAAEVASRFYGDLDGGFCGLRPSLLLLSTHDLIDDVIVRAHWSPEVLVNWMRGEKELDLRESLPHVRAPALVLAARTTPTRRSSQLVRSRTCSAVRRVPQRPGARHSIIRDVPEDGRVAAPLSRPGRARSGVKVAVNGVELFFDVEGTWLVADGPWMRERPSVVLADGARPRPSALQGPRRA